MSFANDVRTEILENNTLRKKFRKAQGYGLLLCSKCFDEGKISMTTERQEIAKLYRSTLLDILGPKQKITVEQAGMGNATRHFSVTLHGVDARRQVLEYFSQQGDTISQGCIAQEGEAAAFISGAYLACGSVTDPEKNYLLEFTAYRAGLAEPLAQLLEQLMGAPPKFIFRRDVGVLYYRESEHIEDVLTAVGAPKSAMELMEVKIIRDMRNKVNRASNCETANIDKTLTASARQIADIEYLILAVGMEGLPEELQDVALKRMENPELSLRELVEHLKEPISRSGLNHRLNRLCRMAGELRQKQSE